MHCILLQCIVLHCIVFIILYCIVKQTFEFTEERTHNKNESMQDVSEGHEESMAVIEDALRIFIYVRINITLDLSQSYALSTL